MPAWEPDRHARVEGSDPQGIEADGAMIVGRLGQLGEELGRGELLREHPRLPGNPRLGHAKGRMDDGRGVDLLGDEVRMRRVEAVQVERLLEVEEQPLDRPAQAVERQGLFQAQPTWFQDVGQQVHPTPLVPIADQAQGQLRLPHPTADFDEPILQQPAAPILPEHRQWPRLDLSMRSDKGALVNVTLGGSKTIAGSVRNLSEGGLCVEVPSEAILADEFELKLFFTGRTSPIESIGKVLWKGLGSRRGMEHVGLAFSVINATDQEAIHQFVEGDDST